MLAAVWSAGLCAASSSSAHTAAPRAEASVQLSGFAHRPVENKTLKSAGAKAAKRCLRLRLLKRWLLLLRLLLAASAAEEAPAHWVVLLTAVTAVEAGERAAGHCSLKAAAAARCGGAADANAEAHRTDAGPVVGVGCCRGS